MSDTVQIVLGICFLVVVFVATRFGIMWKMARTAGFIANDLESKGALDPSTAVDLPYATPPLIRIGMRDYHSKALEYLVNDGAVGKTPDGKYYLKARPASRNG